VTHRNEGYHRGRKELHDVYGDVPSACKTCEYLQTRHEVPLPISLIRYVSRVPAPFVRVKSPRRGHIKIWINIENVFHGWISIFSKKIKTESIASLYQFQDKKERKIKGRGRLNSSSCIGIEANVMFANDKAIGTSRLLFRLNEVQKV